MNVEATCEIKTIAINIPTVSGFSGNSPSRNRVSAAAESRIRYQRRAVSVRSAIGPHKNRQRLADTPIATIDAAIATEKPARQDKWQRDGNKAAADAVGQNEKEEDEGLCGLAMRHRKY